MTLCIDDLVCSGDTIGDSVFFGLLLRTGLVIFQNVNFVYFVYEEDVGKVKAIFRVFLAPK